MRGLRRAVAGDPLRGPAVGAVEVVEGGAGEVWGGDGGEEEGGVVDEGVGGVGDEGRGGEGVGFWRGGAVEGDDGRGGGRWGHGGGWSEGMRLEMEMGGLRDVGVDGGLVLIENVMALGSVRDVVRVVAYAVSVSPAFGSSCRMLAQCHAWSL